MRAAPLNPMTLVAASTQRWASARDSWSLAVASRRSGRSPSSSGSQPSSSSRCRWCRLMTDASAAIARGAGSTSWPSQAWRAPVRCRQGVPQRGS